MHYDCLFHNIDYKESNVDYLSSMLSTFFHFFFLSSDDSGFFKRNIRGKKRVQAMLCTVFAIFLQEFICIFQKKVGGYPTFATAFFDQLLRILLEGPSAVNV